MSDHTLQPRLRNLLVLGVDFENKGALLMLQAITDWAAIALPGSRVVMDWRSPFTQRSRHGVWAGLLRGDRWFGYELIGQGLPRAIRHRLGAVTDSEIDVVLDASGYAYGDSWGADKAERRLAAHIKRWRDAGRKVILLPQAFGPFREPRLQAAMRTICAHANLVFVRDARSATELASVVGSPPNIRRAPDFTIGVSGRPYVGMEACSGAIGLIPNHKMFEKGGHAKTDYLRLLEEVARGVAARGRRGIWIVHEGARDAAVCEEINQSLPEPLMVVRRADPAETKMAIKLCAGVVTSRFHGMASALYQGVPAVGTSWNHKYEELARLYGYPSLVPSEPRADLLLETLFGLLEGPAAGGFRAKAAAVTREGLEETARMWQQVRTVVG